MQKKINCTLKVKTLFAVATALLTLSLPSFADVKLPRLVSDSMVIQRDQPIHIWGWADEGEKVSVTLGKETQAVVTAKGIWSADFKSLKANTVVDIDIQGKNHLQVRNVVAGDVWLASGQSNMETNLARVAPRYPDLIATTQLPMIREFRVPVAYSFKGPQLDFPQGNWKTATPENLSSFSAVGFFFARALHEKHKVPVGIIVVAVGGSPAEAWMSEQALEKYPTHLANYKKFTDDTLLQATIADDKAKADAWQAKAKAEDVGLQAKPVWSSPEINFKEWSRVNVPGIWKEQGIDFGNGVAWVKKEIVLSESQAAQSGTLWMGVLVDADEVYVNGQLVGQTGYRYPPRIYSIKSGILKAGVNNITVRLTSNSMEPAFVKDKLYALQLGAEKLDLAGEWQYKVTMRADAFPKTTTLHYQPASLFNAKLAPALTTPMKGILWYQGESNAGRADEYMTLFPDLIIDWRNQFYRNQSHLKDIPFLFVQLPNFMEAKSEPSESGWAQTREAQRQALKLKNTGMAVAIDLGEWNDIHPLNKQPVGERLFLLADKMVYGNKSSIASGPSIKSVKTKKSVVTIQFDNVKHGLNLCSGSELKYFSVAGADKKFVWATAKINKNAVEVSSVNVTDPKFVRYAWADNPEGANLCGEQGLPASPFEAPVK